MTVAVHDRMPVILDSDSYYAPWVRSRQEQLERDVSSSWRAQRVDQMLLQLGSSSAEPPPKKQPEGEGAPEVRGSSGRAN